MSSGAAVTSAVSAKVASTDSVIFPTRMTYVMCNDTSWKHCEGTLRDWTLYITTWPLCSLKNMFLNLFVSSGALAKFGKVVVGGLIAFYGGFLLVRLCLSDIREEALQLQRVRVLKYVAAYVKSISSGGESVSLQPRRITSKLRADIPARFTHRVAKFDLHKFPQSKLLRPVMSQGGPAETSQDDSRASSSSDSIQDARTSSGRESDSGLAEVEIEKQAKETGPATVEQLKDATNSKSQARVTA